MLVARTPGLDLESPQDTHKLMVHGIVAKHISAILGLHQHLWPAFTFRSGFVSIGMLSPAARRVTNNQQGLGAE
jgi:hypothetical protein